MLIQEESKEEISEPIKLTVYQYRLIPFELDMGYLRESVSHNNFHLLEGREQIKILTNWAG